MSKKSSNLYKFVSVLIAVMFILSSVAFTINILLGQ
ncbi:hypothetical protein J2Z72_001427 [Peptostreptococcus canis]|nr:hypothetical protein [Peptostreptococcus canis]